MSKLWKMRKDILSKLNEFQIYNSLYHVNHFAFEPGLRTDEQSGHWLTVGF